MSLRLRHQKEVTCFKPPAVKVGGLCHIRRDPMRVRSLAPMSCNAHEIERRVEARYDAVEAITFVLNCNRHRHVHAMLAVGRTFIDVT